MTDSDTTALFCCEKEWTKDMKKEWTAPKISFQQIALLLGMKLFDWDGRE